MVLEINIGRVSGKLGAHKPKALSQVHLHKTVIVSECLCVSNIQLIYEPLGKEKSTHPIQPSLESLLKYPCHLRLHGGSLRKGLLYCVTKILEHPPQRDSSIFYCCLLPTGEDFFCSV